MALYLGKFSRISRINCLPFFLLYPKADWNTIALLPAFAGSTFWIILNDIGNVDGLEGKVLRVVKQIGSSSAWRPLGRTPPQNRENMRFGLPPLVGADFTVCDGGCRWSVASFVVEGLAEAFLNVHLTSDVLWCTISVNIAMLFSVSSFFLLL